MRAPRCSAPVAGASAAERGCWADPTCGPRCRTSVWLLALVLLTRAPDPCASPSTVVLVKARQHVLFLCDGGHSTGTYRISIGRGGIGKRREGDYKLPVGRYS